TGLGIFPCLGGTQRSARALGAGLAKWWLYTGRSVSAADASKMGLIDDLVAANELEATARRHALGELPSRRRQELSADLARLAAFFERHRVDDIRSGNVSAQGDPVLLRAIKSVAVKAPLALRFV